MAKDDGGLAFPSVKQWNEWSELKATYTPKTAPVGGMSLRDYFAGQALAGGLEEFFRAGDAWSDYDEFAQSLYRVADAMLKERLK